jgi:hypothetical protein
VVTDTADTPDLTAARRLDGNAAAGALADLFAVELTEARSRCASCGSVSMLGAHHLYADAPALVLRCPSCTGVVLRFAAQRGRLLLDLRGTQLLVVPVPVTGDGDDSTDASDQASPAGPEPANAPG